MGVSAWYTVNTIVIYLWGCTLGGCSCNQLVWHVSVLSSTQSYVGVPVNPRIMVAVSELMYWGSYCPYYGVPAVGNVPLISWKHLYCGSIFPGN